MKELKKKIKSNISPVLTELQKDTLKDCKIDQQYLSEIEKKS